MPDTEETVVLAPQSKELVLPDILRGELAKFKETTKVSEIAGLLKGQFKTIQSSNMLEHFGINIEESELTELPNELGSLTVENVVNQMKSGMELALIFFLPKNLLNQVYSMSEKDRKRKFIEDLIKIHCRMKEINFSQSNRIEEVKDSGGNNNSGGGLIQSMEEAKRFLKNGYNVAASIGATALFLTKNPYDKYIESMKTIFGEDILGLKGLIGNMPAYVGMSFLMCGMIVKKITYCYKSIKERNTSEVCQCALTLVSELLGAYGVSNLPDDFLQNPPSQNVVIGIIALTLIQAAAEQGCSQRASARLENVEGGAMKRKKSKRKSKRSLRSSKRSRRKSRK